MVLFVTLYLAGWLRDVTAIWQWWSSCRVPESETQKSLGHGHLCAWPFFRVDIPWQQALSRHITDSAAPIKHMDSNRSLHVHSQCRNSFQATSHLRMYIMSQLMLCITTWSLAGGDATAATKADDVHLCLICTSYQTCIMVIASLENTRYVNRIRSTVLET